MDQHENEILNETCHLQQSFITVPKGHWLKTSVKLSSKSIIICDHMLLNP